MALHVLRQQLSCEQVPCYPAISVFHIQALHAVVYNRIPQIPVVVILQCFIILKKVDIIRSEMICIGTTKIDGVRSNTFSISAGIFRASASPSRIPCSGATQIFLYQDTFYRYLACYYPQPLRLISTFRPRGGANEAWKRSHTCKLHYERTLHLLQS